MCSKVTNFQLLYLSLQYTKQQQTMAKKYINKALTIALLTVGAMLGALILWAMMMVVAIVG